MRESHCDLCQKDKMCRCSGFGYRTNLTVISGNDKNWGFVVLGEVLVVFPQRHILVSTSLHRYWSDPSVSLHLVHTGIGCCQSFLFGPQTSVDGETLFWTWLSCDERESKGMQVQRTLILRMSLPVGFRQYGIWDFNNSTDHCTELTKKHAQTVDIRLCSFHDVRIGQSPIRCVTKTSFRLSTSFLIPAVF